MKPIQIDFDDSSTFRQAKGKGAAKKAQKQADQAKWADDGGDGANEGGNAGDNPGGAGAGGGGGSNNGDGGAGDDGGGWDDWATGGGKKKKKKGKKGKNEEEDEEKDKEEDGQKDKEEEEEKKEKEANGGAGANDLSWMEDTIAKPDDEWAGFATTDKKGKKSKKGKAEVVPEPAYNAFENINLGGDTPQLDLNFGTDTATRGFSSGGFGAGGFGSSFDTGNTWGFGGLGNGATDITDSIKDTSGAADDVGGWGFGKKNKKTTTTSGFDFGDFATLDEGGEVQGNAGGDQDDWATGFTATSKKNGKKSKKSVMEEVSIGTDATTIGTAVTDSAPAEDSWSAWGTSNSKKDKNKKKKNEPEHNDIPPMPPPPPPPPISEEPPAEDTWSSFGGAKSKKKNKKNAAEEPVKFEEPIVVVPEPEPEADAGWGSLGTKKDKKKGKKDAADDKKAVPDPVVVVGNFEAETKPEDNFDWGLPGKKDKDKKKGKKGVEEDTSKESAIVEVPEKSDNLDLGWAGFSASKDKKKKATSKVAEPAIVAVPDPIPEADAGWGGLGMKKEKKKGRKAVEEGEPQEDDIVAVVEDDDPISGAGWGAFGMKKDKDKKKSKAGATEDFGADSHVIDVPDIEPIVEDSFDTSWGITAPKKGKKDKKGAITEVKEDVKSAIGSSAAAEAATRVADDDFMNWGGGSTEKKKDKKGKKGAVEAKQEEALPPPPPPPPVPFPEEPAFTDTFGSAKKEKKGKKGKTIEPEAAIIEVPDFPAASQEEAPEEDWGNFGLSAKDKKKKEKEKKDKEKEEKAKKEQEELDRQEKEEAERREKEEKEKIKPGKKGKAGTTTASSKTKDLMAGSVPDDPPAVEENFSTSMWGSTKKDSKKKSSKKDNAFEVPPPVPTPPAQGFTPPPEDALDDLLGDDWGNFGAANDKSKKDSKKSSKADESKPGKTTSKGKADEEKAQVETAAKAAKSFWGGMTSTAAPSKSKTTKVTKTSDKDTKEADVVLDDDLDMDEIVDIIEEEPPPKKGSKSKTADSKLAKMSSKEEKASKSSASDKKAKADAEMNALIDLDSFEAKDSKSTPADSSWGFWGSSKKPSGKKGDEPKKEINKQEWTNHSDPLAFLSNEPELSLVADEPAQSQPAKSSKSAMSASKTSAKLSVAQKVKALEEEKKALEPPAPAPAPPPVVDIEPPAKKTSAANYSVARGKVPSKVASASKKKDLSPPAEEEKKKSKDSVPGGFPDDEENLIDMLASSPPVEKKSAKKGAKTVKKEPAPDMMDVIDVPAVPTAPPTPPAEPTPTKPVKKERARVVRDQGASSWGFWGAAPKKATKAKDDADVPPAKKTAAPALTRSKSTKTPKEKDKDIEKSSSSDTKEKKAESRPAKSRGSSFGAFFGAPPPARTKPIRRMSTSAASKTTSKRQSMDTDAFGLPSPPPEDSPAAFGKAAKVMGTTSGKLDRKASSKGKQKAPIIPDPYPIDDDDMVMVNGLEDPIINAPVPRASKSGKEKSSKSKSRPEPKPAPDGMDDVVMVDGPLLDEPEPLAFDEKPRAPAPLHRSATSAKKPQGGKLMGLFGGFGKTRGNSENFERPKSKAAVTDDEALSPRKRTVTGREDSSKRIRRDDRKVRRSDRTDRDTEGLVADALNDGGAATEADDPEIRRQERRAKRDAREPDDRRAHRRGVGKEASSEEPRKAKNSERRPRREDERPPKESSDRANHSSSRPHKSERRRSYMEPPSAGERPKAHRSRTEQSSKKRHSVAVDGGVGEYFDPRGAAAEGAKNNEPYMHGANDHTSSWVKSQLSDPADPPPVEGTVIETTPELGGKGGYAKDDDEARRAARKARRQSRYGPEDEVGDTDRERRRRRKDKGSDGSAAEWGGKEREKLSRRYTDMGGVRLDSGRPSLGAAGKRGSWLKKVTGLGMG
ncbi:MAG: hypothetical protein Q9208_001052 [Pyrenodesmia sp. 3 TL-2023]